MNPLERKLDARNGHVQFDEREVETERMAGYSGTSNRKGWSNSYDPTYTPLRHFSTLQILNGTAAGDFDCGQGGEVGASPQRAVAAEPTRATGKSAAARRFVEQKAVWLRCSSVTGRWQPCSFVAPRHPAFCSTTVPFRIFRQALKHPPPENWESGRTSRESSRFSRNSTPVGAT